MKDSISMEITVPNKFSYTISAETPYNLLQALVHARNGSFVMEIKDDAYLVCMVHIDGLIFEGKELHETPNKPWLWRGKKDKIQWTAEQEERHKNRLAWDMVRMMSGAKPTDSTKPYYWLLPPQLILDSTDEMHAILNELTGRHEIAQINPNVIKPLMDGLFRTLRRRIEQEEAFRNG